jgi:hypothetical protein
VYAVMDWLIELAGEIEDEDRSLGDRAEERTDRFSDYKESPKAASAKIREAGIFVRIKVHKLLEFPGFKGS